jgi:hypothetical protein
MKKKRMRVKLPNVGLGPSKNPKLHMMKMKRASKARVAKALS